MDDHSLVSIIIEKDDEDIVELQKLERSDLHRKKNKQQYEKIIFSMQLYSGSSKENVDQNQMKSIPEDFDEAFEQYKKSKSFKHFRIDSNKHSTASPVLENSKISHQQISLKLAKSPQHVHLCPKEAKGDNLKKAVFSIKPRGLEMAKTIYSANASPFNLKKSFKIAPSPGGTSRKRFFINPLPIKSRILDF